MKVALRVDASRAIGTGHVRRCLALANALREAGAEMRFVTRDLGIDTGAIVAAEGFETLLLPAPGELAAAMSDVPHAAWAGVAARTDAEETRRALEAWSPGWIVIDHYAFDAEWHKAVRGALECRIAAIDDLADRALAVDLLVDHNQSSDHRAKYEGHVGPSVSLLGGPRFALLGPAFADAPRHEPRGAVGSIGIFMGGIDERNLSLVALNALAKARFSGEVEIVSASANPNLPILRAAAASRPGTKVMTDLPNLASFFARHDLQIGAGGGATWERCCVGAPTLLLVAAENQLAVVPELAAEGVVISPEPLGTLDPANIAAALQRLISDDPLRRKLGERSRALVDGLGARRVALRLASDNVTLRPATRADAGTMHRWRNHPATRSVSRNREEIAWEDHLDWLERVLTDSTRDLMLGMVGDLPIGVIRFDRREAESAEVSLYLDPALHGLGLGRAMLLIGEAVCARGLDIHAEIREGNSVSGRLFESAGYWRVDLTHWIKPARGRAQAN